MELGIGIRAPSPTGNNRGGIKVGGLGQRRPDGANGLEIVAGHDLLLLINPIICITTTDLMCMGAMVINVFFLLLWMTHKVDEVLALRRHRSLRQIHYLLVHIRRRIHLSCRLNMSGCLGAFFVSELKFARVAAENYRLGR